MAELGALKDFRAGLPERDELARARVRRQLLVEIDGAEQLPIRVDGSGRTRGGSVVRRPLVLIAAAVVAIVAASTALAWHSLTSIIIGEHPSPAVEKGFVLTGRTRAAVVGRLRAHRGLDLSRIYGALRIQTSGGPVAIWVAPTAAGGFCALTDFERDRTPTGVANGGAVCEPTVAPRNQVMYSISKTRVKNGYVELLSGHVGAHVSRLELVVADGKKLDLPLARGFFLYDIATGRPTRLLAWGPDRQLIRGVTLTAPTFERH